MEELDTIIEKCDEILDGNTDTFNTMSIVSEIKESVEDLKRIKTISLQKFDEQFEDYYDSEQKVFVIYAGDRGFDGSIDPDVKVKDDDGVVWDCYLWKVEYIPSMDTYEILYKPYEE